MSVKSLVSDPEFDKLSPQDKQAALSAVDPDFSTIGVNEVDQVVSSIRGPSSPSAISQFQKYGNMALQAADVALSPLPGLRDIVGNAGNAIVNPAETLEQAPGVLGAAGSTLGPGGAAIGGMAGKMYEMGGKKVLSKLKVPGADRPTNPSLFGMTLPSIPGIPQKNSDVAVEGILQGLIAGGSALGIKGATKTYQSLKNNPRAVGSAIDNYVSAERGTGEVALKHPEITTPEYYNPQRIRQFVNEVSGAMQEYKGRVKNFWNSAADFFDSGKNSEGRIGSTQIRKAVDELRDSFGIKTRISSDLPNGDVKIESGTNNAVQEIENKLNSFKERGAYGDQTKTRLGLKEVLSLRQIADDFIDYSSDLPDSLKRKVSSFRQNLDGIISSKYPQFKPADDYYAKMRNDVGALKENFAVKEGKPAEAMTDNEIAQAESAIRRILKKGETVHDALSRINPKLLEQGKKLAAAGGSAGRNKPFEQTLRPGLTFGKIAGGTGLLGSSYLLGSGHPLLAALGAAGSVATPFITSPRVVGSALRAAPEIIAQGRAVAPSITPALIAALRMRANRKTK
jgi:hypothetical protein